MKKELIEVERPEIIGTRKEIVEVGTTGMAPGMNQGFSTTGSEEFEEYDELDEHGVMVRKKRSIGQKVKDAFRGVFGGRHHHEDKIV